ATIDFYKAAQNQGIKPIIGCEVYIAPGSRLEKKVARSVEDPFYHFILLAKDEEGYRNLMKLVSSGYLEGFYYKPRIDKEILSQNAKGLIGLSACLKSELAAFLKENRFNDALKAADEYAHILGKGNFYIELQENGIPEQKTVNKGLLKIAKELNLPIVATNDVHYLNQEHAASHEALLCIQTQTTLDDPNRMRFQTQEFYFKNASQMKELFAENPEAIKNTLEIRDKCNLELDFSSIHLPKYDPPQAVSKEEFLRKLCEEGLQKKFKALTPQIRERMEHELNMIKNMGFTSYFLIVWDFIHYAKERKIPVGPGRGSAAGSLVSYLLEITDINPLNYGLLFERFLNPERLSLPDIDIDFCYERRQEVIDYVTTKYGQENVAQIITFGTMMARGVIRDVGRVMGMSYKDVDRIAKMVPQELDIKLKDALEASEELRDLYKNDPQVTKLINTAMILEGLTRHASVHAAGVVIADKPLVNYLPLFKTSDEQVTTGYEMGALEKIGLLKVDFLGLRTLTVIDSTLNLIKARHNKTIDLDNVSLDDALTFKLFRNAGTEGVFQLESAGMRDLLRRLAPEKFEDIIALLALYRPGPIGSRMLDDFIRRKHNQVQIRYDHKSLEPILKETYGIILYQEQIMQIANVLASFTLAQSDLLRRAMAKKIPEVMEQQRKNFVLGAHKNGIDTSIANKIFDLIVHFSGYGFNKSHSAAYAMISFRTAYLKAHYPAEFMAALLTSERDNTDKIAQYVAESSHMGIAVLPPDINESDAYFTVMDDKKIRFGLLAVKNLGRGAIDSIIAAREKDGKFKSLYEIVERVDLRLVNRKVLESLIKCGALDAFAVHRAQMVAMLDELLETASRVQREKAKGQMSFFDLADTANGFKEPKNNTPQIREWPQPQLLAFEKEMLGLYISGHPLARYAHELKRFASCSVSALIDQKDGDEIKIVGLIVKVRHAVTRANNEKMAILKIEDLEGMVEVLVFPATFNKVERYLEPNTVVLLKGRLNLREEAPKIIANDIMPIEMVYKLINAININLSSLRENVFDTLKEILRAHPGRVPIYLHLDTPAKSKVQLLVGEELFVEPSEELIQGIDSLLGEERLSLLL
ncbi:MAG: DNA polymerase III subunit alpha, partial [Candidatus Omnitrophica bacterium]|nr:DNA polymerase III subunit alpha [Candidatus Omnitrophota bacterium]